MRLSNAVHIRAFVQMGGSCLSPKYMSAYRAAVAASRAVTSLQSLWLA
jgi:hypothetical protein